MPGDEHPRNDFATAVEENDKPPCPPTKRAAKSKRVKFTVAAWSTTAIAILGFLAGLAHIPFINKNKWIVIVSGLAALALANIGSILGITGSGTKIEFGGNKQ